MAFLKRIQQSLQRLQWKLTFSYTAVTVGALLLAVLILGVLLFSTILAPHELIPPGLWVNIFRERISPDWRYVLAKKPVDTTLVNLMIQQSFGEQQDFQVSYIDLLRIGDLQLTARMMGQANILIVSPERILWGTSNPNWVSSEAIGLPLDLDILPGLEDPLHAAFSGEIEPELLFVDIVPYEQFYFAIPIVAEGEFEQQVLGVAVIYVESLPTESDLNANASTLVLRSALIFLLIAGLIGTLFGFLTAKGMTRRLQQVSEVTEAWSQGDFSEFITDSAGDEISHLADRLNHMAEQLQQYLRRSQELAVSEERNRLARDLHDSAKQEALAASFHLGTALTLFERDPESAKNHLVEADNLVDSVRGELTDLIHELRPPSIDGDNFDETLNEYLIEWAHQTGINATLKVTGSNNLSLDIKQAIYRILQEALANVARHSAAEQVMVSNQYGEQRVELTIRDNGCGFDTQQHFDGIGLESMRERAESLGGDFSVFSTKGQGTKIKVAFPIKTTRE